MAIATAPLTLPPLPYPENALEPIISGRTLSFHHGKHHRAYVETANKLLEGTELADLPLEQIVRASAGQADRVALFDNAAQAWNHDFYWRSLKPKGGGAPPADLGAKIESSFGSVEACKKQLANAATGQFGSGWAWLVLDGDKIKVVRTGNAENPLAQGSRPLLTLDVWEHAYYLDYQNRRADYVNATIEGLLNWGFALENCGRGRSG